MEAGARRHRLAKTGYYVGNRSRQLNCDIWCLTLYGYSVAPAIRLARESGLTDDEIERYIASTIRAASRHWFYRVRTGDFDGPCLTPAQVRVLQALGTIADFDDGSGCRPAEGRASPSWQIVAV